DGYRLHWTYYNNGDYDQNGIVTIGDITPVGLHFGKTQSSSDWNRSRVADGDGNGLVSIADITPIGVNFGSSTASFVLRRSAAANGPFAFVSGGIAQIGSAAVPAGGGPREWQLTLSEPEYGLYYALAVYDGEAESKKLSPPLQFLPDNEPPIVNAVHDASAKEAPGVKVSFDASNSVDPEGVISEFEWD